MKNYNLIRSEMMGSLAKKQELSNLILFTVLAATMIWIQKCIDANPKFFLHGLGFLVYVVAGLFFLLYWIVASRADFSDIATVIAKKGDYIRVRDPLVVKLLSAFLTVTKSMGLDPKKYTLLCRNSRDPNAFSTGVSHNRTICIFSNVVINADEDQLNAVIAHELGHLVNRDTVIAIVRQALRKSVGFLNLITFILICIYWNFWSALLFTAVSGILIPLLINYSARCSEEFADIFACKFSFGPGLYRFLQELPEPRIPRALGPLLNHPFTSSRLRYIENYLAGNDGRVSDKTEHLIWMGAKVLVVAIAALALALTGSSITGFLLAGALFFISDQLMFDNPGTWHINIAQTIQKLKSAEWFKSGLRVLLLASLYVAGIFACIHFMKSDSSLVHNLSLITLICWSAKPFAAALSHYGLDFMTIISELSGYLAVVTSIVMMVSCFIYF